MHISEMMEVLKDLDETSKRKVDILEHFVVSHIMIDLLLTYLWFCFCVLEGLNTHFQAGKNMY